MTADDIEWLLSPEAEVAHDLRREELTFDNERYRVEEDKTTSGGTSYTTVRLFQTYPDGRDELVAAATYGPDGEELGEPYMDDFFAMEHGFNEEEDSMEDIYDRIR